MCWMLISVLKIYNINIIYSLKDFLRTNKKFKEWNWLYFVVAGMTHKLIKIFEKFYWISLYV